MKIAMNNQPLHLPLRAPRPEQKSVYEMDRFELQQEVWDADRQVAQLRQSAASGQTRALVGMGVLFTSLGVMAAQSILMGGSLPGALSIPLAVTAGAGLTAFATGIWKRDTAEMNVDTARMEARHLHSVFEKRFENPKA